MTLIPNNAVVPPDGYHFVDTSTGFAVRIDGSSYEDVAQKVLEHRMANNKAPGNPLQEVSDYVCNTHPHFCKETDPLPATSTPSTDRPHISTRVATWLSSFIKYAQGDRGAHPYVAEQRAETCVNCPKNVPFSSGCGTCQDAISRLSFVWLRDRKTGFDNRLLACDQLSQLNKCAVWSEKLPPITDDQRKALPGQCWRRKL